MRRAAGHHQRAAALKLLGLTGAPTESDVKAAFRRAALEARAHPDLVFDQKAKVKAAREFIRLRDAASLLLKEEDDPPEDDEEEARRSAAAFWRRQDARRAVVKPSVSLEEELEEALRTVVTGPPLFVDQDDKFPAFLEMEERNSDATQPLLRLMHGDTYLGEVAEIGRDALRLSLFDGLVTATARRQRDDKNHLVDIHREGDRRYRMVSPLKRGMTICGFGGFREHTLINNKEETHRFFEYYCGPGVHVGVWRRIVPGVVSPFGAAFDFSPVVATMTKAWYPHKKFWPTFFHDIRPDTHASDGVASAFYLERLASSSTFGPPPSSFVDPSHRRLRERPIFTPDILQGRRRTSNFSALDPVCCVFAAAFHTIDTEQARRRPAAPPFTGPFFL